MANGTMDVHMSSMCGQSDEEEGKSISCPCADDWRDSDSVALEFQFPSQEPTMAIKTSRGPLLMSIPAGSCSTANKLAKLL